MRGPSSDSRSQGRVTRESSGVDPPTPHTHTLCPVGTGRWQEPFSPDRSRITAGPPRQPASESPRPTDVVRAWALAGTRVSPPHSHSRLHTHTLTHRTHSHAHDALGPEALTHKHQAQFLSPGLRSPGTPHRAELRFLHHQYQREGGSYLRRQSLEPGKRDQAGSQGVLLPSASLQPHTCISLHHLQ